MAPKSNTLQQAPTNTGRPPSIRQGKKSEKPEGRRVKPLREWFRSSNNDEDKGQDVNAGSSTERHQSAALQPCGDLGAIDSDPIQTRNHSIPQSDLLSSPNSRPHYPQNDSGYSGDGPPSLPKPDFTQANGISTEHFTGFARGAVDTGGTDIQTQHYHTSAPDGAHIIRSTRQNSFPADKASGQTLERISTAGSVTDLAGLVNENSNLKKRLQAKDQEIDCLRKQNDSAERQFRVLNGEVSRLTRERDEAVSRHAEVNGEYNQAILDLNGRAMDVRAVTKQLEEGKGKWAKQKELEGKLQGRILALEGEVAAKDRYLEKLKSQAEAIMAERDKLKTDVGQIRELEMSYNRTLEQLEELKQQLFTSRGDYEILQQSHSEISTELMRVKIEIQSDVDDAFFVAKFEHLQGDIRTWAQTYFFGEQRKRGVLYSPHNVAEHPSVHDDLEELSEDCRNLLIGSGDGSNRPFIVEAYLWKFIEDKILHTGQSPSSCSKGMFWAHKLRPEMARMEKFLRPGPQVSDTELRMFYKWKATTAKLVIKRLKPNLIERARIPIDPIVMEYMVKQVWHVLGEWISKPEKNYRHDDSCRADLRNILQAAVDFDSHIHEEWSHIFASASPIGFAHRYGFPFSDASMKPRGQYVPGPGELVGTVVSPALIRNGTSTGDGYNEVQEILVPSRVLLEGFSARTQKPRNVTIGGVKMRGLH
ncbi:hypothetical protein BDZ45DRAFT_677833 [Acephala macrosclerotiorum]|nr:hypothetical protein BDZ45DRAFT_677833 [Acephala macrosclerotiorum]